MFAEHGTLGESLGRVLLQRGTITEAQFADAITRVTDTAIANEEIRWGEVLVEMGLLAPEAVNSALQEQTRTKLLQCFAWDHFDHRVEPEDDFLGEIGIYACPVPPLLVEGIERFYEPSRVRRLLGARWNVRPQLKQHAVDVGSQLGLRGRQVGRLRQIDGRRTVAELAATDATTAALVLALTLMDEVHWLEGSGRRVEGAVPPRDVKTQKAPSKPSRSAALASGTGPESSEISKPRLRAAEALVRQLQRGQPSRPRLATRSPSLPQRRRVAQEPTVQPPSAEALERAASAFQRGQRYWRQSARDRALAELRRSVELAPTVAEYAMFCAFAEWSVVQKGSVEKVAALAKKALREKRDLASAHNVLGHVHKHQGDLAAAQRSFDMAIRCDPDDYDAARELRLLARRDVGSRKKTRPS